MTWSHSDVGRFALDQIVVWYHSMTLRDVTRAVLGLVEKTSGCQVIVSEDSSLKTLAAARIARVFPELFKARCRQPCWK